MKFEDHFNIKAIQLLGNSEDIRKFKKKKPFEQKKTEM